MATTEREAEKWERESFSHHAEEISRAREVSRERAVRKGKCRDEEGEERRPIALT